MGVHTVCQSARCPNLGECFGRGRATFMILGDVCTRNCRFCAVSHGRPAYVDPKEPQRVAAAAARLALDHVVITSVTRDDLPDGGAHQFAATVDAVRELLPKVGVEVLVPDFGGSAEALELLMAACPDVLNHNVETAPRLYPQVRAGADYLRSLELLARARRMAPAGMLKSGFMVGLGESQEEVLGLLRDLCDTRADAVTIGQYLQPTKGHLEVHRYVEPEEFSRYESAARQMGFSHVLSGPLVRSSYHAAELAKARSSATTASPGDGAPIGPIGSR